MADVLKMKADPAWGWDLFDASGSIDGRWQVQRWDCPDDGSEPRFEGDGEAWVHVWAIASDLFNVTAEAEYARAVLGFLMVEHPAEYARIKEKSNG